MRQAMFATDVVTDSDIREGLRRQAEHAGVRNGVGSRHAHAESIAHGGSARGGRSEDAELVRVLGPRAEESGSAGRALLQQARTAALVFT